jgi:hypothetical protein
MAQLRFVPSQCGHLETKVRIVLGQKKFSFAPKISRPRPRRLVSTSGPSFTLSHVAANGSGTGLVAGIISVGDIMVRLVTNTPGTAGRGIGAGTSRSTASAAELSTFGSVGSIGREELERVPVEDVFLFQGRGKERAGSVTFRCWGGSSEFPRSTEIAGVRLAWLDFLSGLKKGIVQIPAACRWEAVSQASLVALRRS